MAINTLQIANRLKAAEREGRSAEEIALVFGEIEEERFGRLVTRDQLTVELDKLRAEIGSLRAEMHAEFDKLRLEMEKMRVDLMHAMTLRLGAMIAAAVAIIAGMNVWL